MREKIGKYRGKRVDNGEWVFGYLTICNAKINNGRTYILETMSSFEIDDDMQNGYYIGRYLEVDPSTVGEYTGRTAQCTDEIFEHDVCSVTVFDHNGGDTQYKCVVEWAGGGFAFVNSEQDVFIPLCEVEDTDSDVEIIGNIHDKEGT